MVVGSVLAGVLAFVALVAGSMAAAGSVGLGDDPFGFGAGVDTPATAEVLDVDVQDPTWPTVDVRWTTADGEVVVTFVDWEWSDDLPAVGDQVEVLYDSADPEWAFAADDPYASGAEVVDQDTSEEPVADGPQDGLETTAGWVALTALLGLAVTAVVTVVAAVRAPAPVRPVHQPGVYEAPHPGAPYGGAPYGGAPYGGAPYAGAPSAGAPDSGAPYAGGRSDEGPRTSGHGALTTPAGTPAGGTPQPGTPVWPHPG